MNQSVLPIDEVFWEASRLAPGPERQAYLDRACGGAAAARQAVEKLLRAHDQAEAFLEQPFAGPAPTGPLADDLGEDARVGPYRLRELLGEGGMGAVYVADQEAPVKRRVALKVVKPGMDSRQVLARFEAERQALALMDHPNIARILDAGTTDRGRPYFVMELVRGEPVTDYCDHARLTTRQRLELFVQVCQAVQHAHQKGVIHRDLKPSNVLVTLYDGRPVPKVIDFGIAKAVGGQLTDHTVYTRLAQMVGTPLYMSPEQAELSALDVDTRSDVYSLGVLLYELLTGTTPFDAGRLRSAGYDEVRRIIREDEPPRPSHRVGTLGAEAATTVSARRGVDGSRLADQLRGELDWVVMRCLEKDRDRRYQSAAELAADVGRHLRDEAVEACPPSAGYRARKYWRRNRRWLAVAGLFAAILIATTAVSVWQSVQARAAQKQAEAAEDRAVTEAAIAKAVNDFFQQDVLRQVRRDAQLVDGLEADPNLTVREALDRAAAKLGDRFRDQPLVEAALRRTISQAYIGVADERSRALHLERAEELYRTHLGPDHVETLATRHELAMVYQYSGHLPDAVAVLDDVLARRQATLGPDHEDTLNTLNCLGEACRKAGRLDRALELVGRALDRKTAVLGPDCATTAHSVHDLGLVLRDMGRYPEAIARFEEAKAKLAAVYGPNDRSTLFCIANLAGAYQLTGRLDQADRLLREAIRRAQTEPGAGHGRLALLQACLGRNLLTQDRPGEAAVVLREAVTAYEKAIPQHRGRLEALSLLGEALAAGGEDAAAEPLLLQACVGFVRLSSQDIDGRRQAAEAVERVVRFYEATDRPDKARAWREEMAPARRAEHDR